MPTVNYSPFSYFSDALCSHANLNLAFESSFLLVCSYFLQCINITFYSHYVLKNVYLAPTSFTVFCKVTNVVFFFITQIRGSPICLLGFPGLLLIL